MQAHIFYSGMVQGVGFRYSVRRLASVLSLKGWVRNLSDGRVEILAEGSQEDIDELMEKISQDFQGYIKDKSVDYTDQESPFSDFQITF